MTKSYVDEWTDATASDPARGTTVNIRVVPYHEVIARHVLDLEHRLGRGVPRGPWSDRTEITLGRHAGRVRVFLNDVDVTGRCRWALAPAKPFVGNPGEVELVVCDERGQPRLTPDLDDVLTEKRKGIVRWFWVDENGKAVMS